MRKNQFNDGTPITPEWLNSIQNPTFEGSSEDVGHLPLPPNYSEKQQCKTIHVSGENTFVNLGDWPYNAVILVHRHMNNDTPVYPRNLTVRCSNSTGAIIVIPELDQNGVLSISLMGSGSTEYATASAKNGDIILMNAFDNAEFVETHVRKIQSGERVEYINVLSSVFTFGSDTHKVTAYIDNSNNLVFDVANGSTANSITFKIPFKAPSIECGTEVDTGYFKAFADDTKAGIKIKHKGVYGSQFFEYSSESGTLSQGHSYENDSDIFSVKNAELDLYKNHSGSGYGYESHILFNKTVDNGLNVVSSPGTICTYKSDGGSISGPPVKTDITPQGIASYTYLDNQWVPNT